MTITQSQSDFVGPVQPTTSVVDDIMESYDTATAYAGDLIVEYPKTAATLALTIPMGIEASTDVMKDSVDWIVSQF